MIDLAAPAASHYKVSFRWIGARGRTLAGATRWSPTCSQPELRPDLVVQSIDVQPIPGKPSRNLYVATVADNGATSARNFNVELAPAGGARRDHFVALLKAHQTTTSTFEGPACNNTAASTITADPDGVVDDFNRANNTMTAGCSSSAGQP